MSSIEFPEMKEIEVSPDNLVLDPNNPRLKFVATDGEYVPDEEAARPGVADRTISLIRRGEKDRFKISQLEKSIIANGWQPVDRIFVKKIGDGDLYLVLEGNRRITAIKNVLDDKSLASELRDALQKIEVLEVLGDGDPESLRKQISYLLGVRHHGSLKHWGAYSQAHNIYGHYLRLSDQSDESFLWDETIGRKIANSLSIKTSLVKERLQVYRAMIQIARMEKVKGSESRGGGMKESYYSICKDGLLSNSSGVREFLNQDSQSFLLGDIGLERIETLCSFSVAGRDGAPMRESGEWRFFAKIFADPDQDKKEQNIQDVLEHHKQPSSVWAKREEELRKLQWDRWLERVALLLQKVSFGDDFGEDAKLAIGRLVKVTEKLTEREREAGQ